MVRGATSTWSAALHTSPLISSLLYFSLLKEGIIWLMDVDRLQLSEANRWDGKVPPCPKPGRNRRGGEFLKGPVPLRWLGLAASLPGKALAVGVALWFEAGRKRSHTVKLTQAILKRLHVSRHAAYSRLRAMESAGLILVERQPRKAAIVTILDLEETKPTRDGV